MGLFSLYLVVPQLQNQFVVGKLFCEATSNLNLLSITSKTRIWEETSF